MRSWYEPGSLPQFERPPVTETAMGFEHAPLAEVDVLVLAEMQKRWASDYNQLEVVPGSPPSFGDREPASPVQFVQGNPPQKVWAKDLKRGLLLQSQADRLILNWRKDLSDGRYPGFDFLLPEYAKCWEHYVAFLGSRDLPIPTPVLSEFTYVNRVTIPPGGSVQSVIKLLNDASEGIPGEDEVSRFQFVRHVGADESNPLESQIVITGEPAASDEKQKLILTVAVKSIISEQASDPFLPIRVAHALASHTFAGVVADSQTTEWGRLN